jgi:LPPG:FO 2-phospho-L-lactate transferase
VAVSGIERCVVLAGGTGGAKLAAGMQELLGSGLSVIANTADDIEIAGVDVSPDPDLITYWLSGEIDEQRGWGIKGDSFTVFDRLVKLGTPDWFRLSDRDLATCLYRSEFVAEGASRTAAQAQIARALGVAASVLPMSEKPVRSRVRTAEGWRGLQQYLVAEHAHAQVEEVQVDGIGDAEPTPEVLEAISTADAIVIGPSNPVISIGPIVSMPAMREAIGASTAPVVAVSPYVAGEVVKGPTDIFMRAIGRPSTAAGAASLYQGLIDGMVCDPEDPDPPPDTVRVLSCPTLMQGREGRRSLAELTLEFASTLGRRD